MNHFEITGNANAGQTMFSGVGPQTESDEEFWTVNLRDAGGAEELSEQLIESVSIDLNTTAEQLIVVTLSMSPRR